MVSQAYEPLAQDMPSVPPGYDEIIHDDDMLTTTTPGIEQFEIDEGIEHYNQGRGHRFMVRAQLLTQKLAGGFSTVVLRPVSRMVDPIYEGYKYFISKYETGVLKLGNPLVVNRLLYVMFILLCVYLTTKYDNTEGLNGRSGGAFSNRKFYDMDKLGNSLAELIDENLMKENLHYLSSFPHITGTKGDLALAKYIQKYMHNNGIQRIETSELQSFINYPVYNPENTYLKLADNSVQAELFELHNKEMQFLAYNPNSLFTNEDIETGYVFANYGTVEDFKFLADKGIKIENCVVFVRYGGGIPEGNKVHLAQKANAAAMVFITDEFKVDSETYDNLIAKTNVGLTRSSPGDVLTPGWASEGGYISRLPWFKSETTPKIPTIPISWKDGKQFLSKLTTGVEIGSDQKFKTGDGSVKVKLKITNENRATHPIWNVVGSIQGREQQEMGVIIGAARDSSCYGTLGTNTGTVALLELVKIFTTLQREYNWIPTRSIYFASWDATENNLSGSSEWIENKREALKNEGYAYIDMSDLVSGDKLSIKSHPLLKSVIKDALRSVKQVGNDKSLYDLYKDQHHGSDDITNNMLEEKNYLPFINAINMPSMEVKFTGTKYPKGTCLDTFEFFENTKIDSDMTKHKQIVELLGLIVLNLAEAPLIPYSFPELSTSLDRFTKDLEKYTRHVIDSLESNKLPNIKFDSLHRALEMLRSAGSTYEEFVNSWRQYIAETEDLEPTLLSMKRWKWNDDLVSFNQRFLFKDSSPTRPGFLNMLIGLPFMAPNVEDDEWQWNSFPTIRDSLYTRDFGKVQSDLNQVATLISMAAQRLFDPYG